MDSSTVRLVLAFTQNTEKNAKNYTDSAIAAIVKGLVYQGAVNYYSELESVQKEVGYTYTVKYKGNSGNIPDGTEYAWGEYDGLMQWIALGPNIMNKADKIPDGTIGNIVTVGDDGNPVDSGKSFANILSDDDKGRPNGVAALNQSGVVPSSQLPISCAVQGMELRINTELI